MKHMFPSYLFLDHIYAYFGVFGSYTPTSNTSISWSTMPLHIVQPEQNVTIERKLDITPTCKRLVSERMKRGIAIEAILIKPLNLLPQNRCKFPLRRDLSIAENESISIEGDLLN